MQKIISLMLQKSTRNAAEILTKQSSRFINATYYKKIISIDFLLLEDYTHLCDAGLPDGLFSKPKIPI
jgi:hypothetical protein